MSHVGTIRVGRLLCEGAEAVTGIALLVISDFPWYCMLWTSRRRRNGQTVSAPFMFCRELLSLTRYMIKLLGAQATKHEVTSG